MTERTLREKIEALVASAKDDGEVMFNRAIYQVLDILDAHTAAQPAPDAVAEAREAAIRAILFPDAAALDRLIAERVREATADLRGLLWLACHEFNAIRARSGAPLDHYGMATVSEEWWDQMTRAFADAVGPDAKKPWPSEEAKAVTAKIAARASKEGRDG